MSPSPPPLAPTVKQTGQESGIVNCTELWFFDGIQKSVINVCRLLQLRSQTPPGLRPPGPHWGTSVPSPWDTAPTWKFLQLRHASITLGLTWCHRSLEDGAEARAPSTSPAGTAVDSTSAAEDAQKRSAKIIVEDGVQDRIDGRVGVAEPEEESVQ